MLLGSGVAEGEKEIVKTATHIKNQRTTQRKGHGQMNMKKWSFAHMRTHKIPIVWRLVAGSWKKFNMRTASIILSRKVGCDVC